MNKYETSAAILITFQYVVASPVIDTQPEDQIDVPEGSTASFSVTVTGSSLTYQWQKDGADIIPDSTKYSGIETASLAILNVVASDDGMYGCVVTNGAGEATSSDVTLTVCEYLTIKKKGVHFFLPSTVSPPIISTQPMDIQVAPRETVLLTVEADGRDLLYQWYRVVDDGDDIMLADSSEVFGGDSDTLILLEVSEAEHEGARYYVIVSNDAGSTRSNTAVVTIGECLR